MVEHGRLKGNKAYPHGFAPTFHPERIRHYKLRDKRPMLIFLNDMGDVGGEWFWRPSQSFRGFYPGNNDIASEMVRFANLNPEHIILMLTKNPAWYALAKWPNNVWCGFTATNNEEADKRYFETKRTVDPSRIWCSLEPWYDPQPPRIPKDISWVVIGGQTNPNKPVSDTTLKWAVRADNIKHHVQSLLLGHVSIPFRLDFIDELMEIPSLFVKDNAGWSGTLREYPDEFRYKPK